MIIDQLNQKFPDMPDLRVRDIKVDKLQKKVTCVVSHPNMSDVDKTITQSIRAVVASNIPRGYRYEIMLVNDRMSETSIRTTISDLLKRNYPLFANIKGDKIAVNRTDDGFSVAFVVSPTVQKNMEAACLLDELSVFFANYTCFPVDFSVVLDNSVAPVDVSEQERLVQLAISKQLLKPQRYFNVTDVVKHIGKEIVAKPMYISDVREPMANCVVCGRISDKEIRSVKNNPTLKLCKFNLTDDSGATIPCLMFARFEIDDFDALKQKNYEKPDSEVLTISKKKQLQNDKKMKMLTFLSNDLEVLVRGKVVYSDFSQRLELQAYDICKCRIQPIALQPKFHRDVPSDYVLVKPQTVQEYRQLTIDRLDGSVDCVLKEEYVVLYANVTGYSVTKDKVLAIGAVRIRDGRVVEKFATFVSPEMQLTDQQLSDIGVSVRQLTVSPTLTEVIADLYKFVGTATLVGNNLALLLPLLNYYAAPMGYNFTNKVVNTLDMLSQLFDGSNFDNKPNCSIVEDVAKVCKVPFRGGARAEDLSMVVAQCMVTLSESQKAR